MVQNKPYILQEPKQVALNYGGDKNKIRQAAQLGAVDPTAAVLAGMFIDEMRAGQLKEQVNQGSVAQKVFGIGTPNQPQMGVPSQLQTQVAGTGVNSLPVSDEMFTAAEGGIVAFADAGSIPTLSLPDVLKRMSMQELEFYNRTGRVPEKYRQYLPNAEQAPQGFQEQGVPSSSVGAPMAPTPSTTPRLTFADFRGATPEKVDPFSATQTKEGYNFGQTEAQKSVTDPGFVEEERTPSAAMKEEKPPVKKEVKEEGKKEEAKEEDPNSFNSILKRIEADMGKNTVGDELRSQIKADREARKDAKENAMYMFMANLGAGMMAGESRYPLVNVGKGMNMALSSYRDDLKEQKKLDREDRKILYELDRADRAEKQNNYKLASEMREKALDRMSAEKRTQITADATERAAQLSAEATKAAYSMMKPSQRIAANVDVRKLADEELLGDRTYRDLLKKDPAAAAEYKINTITRLQRELGLSLNTGAWGQLTTLPGAK